MLIPSRVRWIVCLSIFVLSSATIACNLGQSINPQPADAAAAQVTAVPPTYGAVIGGPGNPQNAAQTTVTPDNTVTATTATTTATPTVPSATPALATQAGTAQVAGTPTMTGTPLPTLIRDDMGIQAYADLPENQWNQMLDRAQFMGFGWIKVQLSWKELETAKGQFSPQYGVLITNFFDAGKRGFKLLISVAKAPDWARPANARGQRDGPPANPQDLTDFMLHIMGEKDLKEGFIHAVEIWNEPNTVTEWTGAALNGSAYATLFKPVYQAIRSAYPNDIILTAGPAPTGDSQGSVDDRKWLQQLYGAGLPISDPNFAIGAHPYGWANAPDARCCASPSKGWDDNKAFFFLDTIADYRAIMTQNKHQNGKLWVTEFGWSSYDGLKVGSHVNGQVAMPPNDPSLAWMSRLTEDQQANYIIRAFQLAQTGDLASYLGPMFLWNLNFSSLAGFTTATTPSRQEAGFSVLNADTFPRAAYVLLQGAPKK